MVRAALMLVLALIVFGAFVTEAIVGFGSTVLTVTLGAYVLGIDALLARFVPLNMLLSLMILARSAKLVEGRLLVTSVLPPVALGMVPALLLARHVTGSWLRLVFGLFVTALALLELVRHLRETNPSSAPLKPMVGRAMLVFGGVIHGLFGSGGPLIVYVLSRVLGSRGAQRATLAALWLAMNAVLLATFVAHGKLTAATLHDSLWLLPSLAGGMIAGDVLHHRLPERPFRLLVYLVLLVAGGTLTARTMLGG